MSGRQLYTGGHRDALPVAASPRPPQGPERRWWLIGVLGCVAVWAAIAVITIKYVFGG